MNFRRDRPRGAWWHHWSESAEIGAAVFGVVIVALAIALAALAGPPPAPAPVLTYTLSDGTRCAVPREGAGISCDWRKP